jgi:hypothetical protein
MSAEPTTVILPAQARAHHPYSPSTLQAREACPKYQPAHSESAASLKGTRQHDAVENEEDNPLLGDHEALAVAECLGYADSVAKKYPGGTILKEKYVKIDDEDTTGGFPDFVVVSADGKTAEIIDWKFGQHGVESTENNLQGIAYLLGTLHEFRNLETCTVHFVLPHRDEIDYHTFKLTREFVDGMTLRIKVIVARSKQAAADPFDFSAARPSVSACLFCGLVGKCPKVAEFVLKISQKFSPMELPQNISPTLIHDPDDTSLGIKIAQVATAWAKSFRAAATDKALTDPDFIPEGYILVSMQRRSVVDAKKVAEVGKQFLPEDKAAEVDKLFDIPITGVEELIELVTPRGKKKHAVEAFAEALDKSGAVELGAPYAILKLSSKKKSSS